MAGAEGHRIGGAGLAITLRNTSGVTVDGDLAATGEITAQSTGVAVALSGHRHPLTGGAETGAPLPS